MSNQSQASSNHMNTQDVIEIQKMKLLKAVSLPLYMIPIDSGIQQEAIPHRRNQNKNFIYRK